jgi:hypothetical protein
MPQPSVLQDMEKGAQRFAAAIVAGETIGVIADYDVDGVSSAALLRRFVELCPGKTMSLEVIVTGPRPFNWKQPDFWKGYENVPAWSFARFAALAAAGRPQEYAPVPKEQAQAREREDFEASNVWMRKFFGV